jgi:hypothetical protein
VVLFHQPAIGGLDFRRRGSRRHTQHGVRIALRQLRSSLSPLRLSLRRLWPGFAIKKPRTQPGLIEERM